MDVLLWPLLLYLALAFVLVVLMIALSSVLGQRHRERGTEVPYESGMIPTGSAWRRFDVKYYLFAVFFVIFDVEAVFIFAWAVSLKRAGWAGYLEMLVFILVLLGALVYLWRTGALDLADSAKEMPMNDKASLHAGAACENH